MQTLFNFFIGIAKVLRYWQVALLIVVLQLFAGWLLAFPLTSAMHETWDHSLLGEHVARGDFLPSVAVGELLVHTGNEMSALYRLPFMIAFGGAYLVIQIFIIAGLLPLYSGLDLKFNWDRYWSDAARYFRPFLGLAIVAMFFFYGAHLLSTATLNLVTESVAGSNDEAAVFVSTVLFTTGFRFLLFSLVVMVFQYAKIISASEQLRNIIYLVRRAFAFVARNFLRALLLFFMLGLLEMGITAMDVAVWHYMLQDAGVVAQWIWIAVVTAALTMARLAFFSAQSVFFNEARRKESEAGSIRVSSGTYIPASDYS